MYPGLSAFYQDSIVLQGWYLPEAAHPYWVLKNAGIDIDFAAPKGPNPPVDPSSVKVNSSLSDACCAN